ncbi:PREDICTED: mRNAion factor [Prunus dulcis]|uniref:PREDICTED: mRNAion factor n=1 Tax=Prunus dulcis TaxID=3755 RepID=A0A5E4G5V5_PRUDU|nr:transcription factor bHLH94-like [Prunus dulcis]KAI5324730.1 hypothetical protein L3X38_033803 [Prunus dulcis]VVA35195.1 PREDICTED: mRNAion factor [Prunus dulcis]
MTLEAVVLQADRYSYGFKDFHAVGGGGGGSWSHGFGFGEDHQEEKVYTDHHMLNNDVGQQGFNNLSLEASMLQSVNDFETNSGSAFNRGFSSTEAPAASTGRRKRRRIQNIKNKEDMETQRMTHIAVERNRRKQMNDYLAALRAMMPACYAQRGDQASIIGGAINFVKELEQLLQSLEGHRRTEQQHLNLASIFSSFFTFPQYSTCLNSHGHGVYNSSVHSNELMAEKRSAIADVEVTMVESHANVKVLMKKQPRQLLKMVLGLHSLGLMILHVNVTTADNMILYTFSVKVEDNSQLTSMNEIAADVYEMVGRIQEEAQLLAQ